MRYSSSRIQQETRLVSVDYLIDMVEIGRLEPSPTFGSLPNWNTTYRSRTVEHLILGLPVEMVWAEQDELGKIQLLSGFDVISIILAFRHDKLLLRRMRILKHLEGLHFSELDYVEQKHFMQMEVSLGTIYSDSDPMLKCLFIEDINRDKYKADASQIARAIIFKRAFYYLDRYTDKIKGNFYVDRAIQNREYDRYRLRLQKEILICLLIVYVNSKRGGLNSSAGLESYSYSRSHISRYSNHDDVDVNFDDDIENALNKIMFMIEVDNRRLSDCFEYTCELIDKAFRINKIELSSIGKVFSYNLISRRYKKSLVESVVSLMTGNTRSIEINRFSSVGDLFYRIEK